MTEGRSRIQRREFLRLVGLVGLAGLAGCQSSDGETGTERSTPTATATPTATPTPTPTRTSVEPTTEGGTVATRTTSTTIPVEDLLDTTVENTYERGETGREMEFGFDQRTVFAYEFEILEGKPFDVYLLPSAPYERQNPTGGIFFSGDRKERNQYIREHAVPEVSFLGARSGRGIVELPPDTYHHGLFKVSLSETDEDSVTTVRESWGMAPASSVGSPEPSQ